MDSLDALNKQKAEHLKKYPDHTMEIKLYKGIYILVCEDCAATWQDFQETKEKPFLP